MMIAMQNMLNHVRAVFTLNREERLILGGVILITLIGLAARHHELKNEKPEPYQPSEFQHAQEVTTE